MIFSIKRLVAYGMDMAMLVTFLVLPQWFMFRLTDGFPFDLFETGLQVEIWVLITMSLPMWLYFIVFERLYQKTFGKWIMGMKVTNRKGERIGWFQAIGRTFWRMLPWELFILIMLIPEPFWIAEGSAPLRTTFLYMVNVMMIMYLIFLAFTRGKRTMHDAFFATEVVKAK